MIRYEEDIVKRIRKGLIPREIFNQIDNAFKAISLTQDLSLFDLKHMKGDEYAGRMYYRLRKGKYRAIFYIEGDDIFVIALDKREEIYRKWQ